MQCHTGSGTAELGNTVAVVEIVLLRPSLSGRRYCPTDYKLPGRPSPVSAFCSVLNGNPCRALEAV